MSENTICPICGGVLGAKRGTVHLAESTVGVKFVTDEGKLACMGHPGPAVKHDGWLGPKAEGLAPYVSHAIDPWINKPMVRIEHANRPSMDLFPHQALSLLAWLTQEESTLQRLAKEQAE